MNSPVKTLHKRVSQEAFECAGLLNNALLFGALTVSDISDNLRVTELDRGKFSACPITLPRMIPVSRSDWNLGDITMHPAWKSMVSLKLTSDLQMPMLHMDSSEEQTCWPSANGQLHLNEPSSNFYFQETSIPPHGNVSAVSLQVEPSVKKAPKSPILLPLEDPYSNQKHENSAILQISENHMPKPISNNQKRNHIESCCPQREESSPEPPVLHLFKNPVALTYPRYISCAISQRPDRSEIHNQTSSGAAFSRKLNLDADGTYGYGSFTRREGQKTVERSEQERFL